nr:hypothetical protein [Tanacetum cinerariifolium]
AVLDNVLNSRTRKLMSTLLKARASCDAIWEKEVEKDKAYADLERRLYVHPSKFAKNIGDTDDALSEKDEITSIGCSVTEKSQNRKASKVASDVFDPLDVDSDLDIHATFRFCDFSVTEQPIEVISSFSERASSVSPMFLANSDRWTAVKGSTLITGASLLTDFCKKRAPFIV